MAAVCAKVEAANKVSITGVKTGGGGGGGEMPTGAGGAPPASPHLFLGRLFAFFPLLQLEDPLEAFPVFKKYDRNG